jgi:methyl acetate hydrolase
MTLQETIDRLLADSISSKGLHCATVALFDRDGTTLESAAGTTSSGSKVPITNDSVVWVASLTKAITATAAMILVERGQLDLDAPASSLVPWLGEAQVLEGFESTNTPILRPARGAITTRQLLTHTAGFGYGFWNDKLARFEKITDHPSIGTGSLASLKAPLVFDPGTDWLYGINMDWAGVVVEAASGSKLGQFMREEILDPLGMDSTGFDLSENMRKRLVRQNQRGSDGTLSEPKPAAPSTDSPELEMGGGGLFSTVTDYTRFARMILNGGELDGARILQPGTVAEMSRNQIGDLRVKLLSTTVPEASGDAEFFPGIEKTFSLGFMINEEDAPTGRPAGSLAWAGMANSYYWIDPKNGIGGVFTSSLLPFVDTVALPLYLQIEKTVYDHL